jgi:UPF0042 nucleotide-binding protein
MSDRALFIVTGMSGAGRSQVMRALEDAGFYCVDNLPLDLFPIFMELLEGARGESRPRLALGLDLREEALDERFPAIYETLRKSPLKVQILFVDASDGSLLRRFSETRRPHPLAPKGSVEEGIALERKRLTQIREKSDRIIDTTHLTVHQLKSLVEEEVARFALPRELALNIVSFGFAYGLPSEASMVLDVRFLPNPHFVPDLRPLDGEDPQVAAYALESPEGREFMSRLEPFLRFLVPQYQREGKSYLTLAVGCTGGRHRSVAVARRVYDMFRSEPGLSVKLLHRDRVR